MIPIANMQAEPSEDDRVTCLDDCANYRGGRCSVYGYHPCRTLLRRCEGFKPRPGDKDQRNGLERWPGLVEPSSK